MTIQEMNPNSLRKSPRAIWAEDWTFMLSNNSAFVFQHGP